MNRGEIWWANVGGTRRPALIMSRSEVIPLVRKLIVIPASTRRRGIPSELDLDEDDGMPRECVLSFDNIEVLDKAHFVNYICTLGDQQMQEACHTLAVATGCRD